MAGRVQQDAGDQAVRLRWHVQHVRVHARDPRVVQDGAEREHAGEVDPAERERRTLPFSMEVALCP